MQTEIRSNCHLFLLRRSMAMGSVLDLSACSHAQGNLEVARKSAVP